MKKFFYTAILLLVILSYSLNVCAKEENNETTVSGNETASEDDESPVVPINEIGDDVQDRIAENVSSLMQQTESQNHQDYISIDSAFATMKDSLVNGSAVSLTQAASRVEGFEFDYQPAYDAQKYALCGAIDFAQVNYDYENIIGAMQLATDIDITQSPITAMELFDDKYQGVWEAVQLDDLSIDAMYEGINVNDALNSVKIEFADSFADCIETGSFATVKDLLSIGSVFQMAADGVQTQSLRDMNYLTSLTAGQTNHNLSLAYANSGVSDLTEIQSQVNGIADWSQIKVDNSYYTLVDNGNGSFEIMRTDAVAARQLQTNIGDRIQIVEDYQASAPNQSGSPYIGKTNLLEQDIALNALPLETQIMLRNADENSISYKMLLSGGLASLYGDYNNIFADSASNAQNIILQQQQIDPNRSPSTQNLGGVVNTLTSPTNVGQYNPETGLTYYGTGDTVNANGISYTQ